MKPDQIKVGGIYVKKNETIAREVIAIAPGTDSALYLSYSLADGKAAGDFGPCSVFHLANWAGREATEDEIRRLDRKQAALNMEALMQSKVKTGLQLASDDQLLEEVRTRGLTI